MITAFVLIQTEADTLPEAAQQIADIDGVVEVYSCAGDVDLIAMLRAAIDVPLVLHGSSGVPSAQLRSAITSGMTKINVGTLLNIAFTGSITNVPAGDLPVDPRRYLGPARAAMAQTVARLIVETRQ